MKIPISMINAVYGPAALAAFAISSATAETETLQHERKHHRELGLRGQGQGTNPGVGVDQTKNKFVVVANGLRLTKNDGDPDVNEPNIVNGDPVDPPRKYKFFVSIGGCGASLVAPNVILSAAHCAAINGPAVLGLHTTNVNGVEEFENIEVIEFSNSVTHPQYNSNTLDNDYWVIQLSHDSQLYKDYAVELDTADGSASVLTSGRDVTVIGMGTTSSGGSSPTVLQEVTVDYVANADCCTGSYEYGCNELTPNMMCAARQGKDSCQGDSGGPIFDTATQKQVGIVSWGYGCADSRYPGVYSRISAKYDWIKTQIDNFDSGGANPPPSKTVGQCYDSPEGWYDAAGDSCGWYTRRNCRKYGNGYANGGITANSACCSCGAGEIFGGDSPPPPTPSPPPPPSTCDSINRKNVCNSTSGCRWNNRQKSCLSA